MDRISSQGTVTIDGIRQWVNKNLLAGIPGTQTDATYETDMQEELVGGLIVYTGLTPTAGNRTQVRQAIGILINTAISAEANTRNASDVNLQNNISAEAMARSNADTALQNNINTEAATRAAAIAALFSTVNSETGSRSVGVVYTNTTGRPMFVSARGYSSSNFCNMILTIAGTVSSIGQPENGTQMDVGGIVPPGGTYEVTFSTGTPSITNWTETY